jgi:23S rRNA pseudouridine1911/1915/1917 synthase
MMNLSVPEPNAGERLDRFLATAQTDLSRSRLQALIRGGHVQVNGRIARASHRLRGGDSILLALPDPEPESPPLAPEARPLAVVHEDEWLMVLDKPAGLVVHPGAGVRTGTLVHALLHHHPAIAGVGGADRPGIVHRLDKDTSGLMVIAKHPRTYRALVQAIAGREVTRVYQALVWGAPHVDSGRIEGAIGRDPRHRKRMAVVRRGGRPAVTHWRVLERFGSVATLLEARLETGRTHQIRVHLAWSGHPVVGDPTYRQGKKKLSLSARERSLAAALVEALDRQALHASELELTHPLTGARLRFSAPVPRDFGRALDLARTFGPHAPN